jgi:hypothetical protein
MAADDHSPPGSYTLSSQFLLIATLAVLLGMAAPILHRMDNRLSVDRVLGATLACGFAFALIGACVGSLHYRRARGVAWGIITGGLLGVCTGPLAFLPLENFAWLLVMAGVGVVLILGLATAIRFSSPRSRRAVRPACGIEESSKPKPHPLDPE